MYEIKVENKNLIITDPCYLNHVMDEGDKTGELSRYWETFLGGVKGDDYHSRLTRFGFTDTIVCGTLYGDWSCTTYQITSDPKEIKTIEDLDKLAEMEEGKDKYPIGEFCADAGMVCVVDAEELKKFNPYFFEWALFHKHCVTAIRNFTGTVGVLDIDPKHAGMPHFRVRTIYGIADKEKNQYGSNFFAYQTGL